MSSNTMQGKNILSVHNLTKSVGENENRLTILTDIEMNVKYSETVALIGESGSGKSTLLGILAGLDDASAGDVILLDHNLTTLNEDERAQLRSDSVGFVFQSFMLVPTLTALENVQLPALLRGANDTVSKAEAEKLLSQLGLGKRLNHLPTQLSGGEQQRVALARAFNGHPQVLFADEPTGNLDRQTGEHIVDLLFSLNRDYATTLILVTHDLNLAARCQRQFQLVNGSLREITLSETYLDKAFAPKKTVLDDDSRRKVTD